MCWPSRPRVPLLQLLLWYIYRRLSLSCSFSLRVYMCTCVFRVFRCAAPCLVFLDVVLGLSTLSPFLARGVGSLVHLSPVLRFFGLTHCSGVRFLVVVVFFFVFFCCHYLEHTPVPVQQSAVPQDVRSIYEHFSAIVSFFRARFCSQLFLCCGRTTCTSCGPCSTFSCPTSSVLRSSSIRYIYIYMTPLYKK